MKNIEWGKILSVEIDEIDDDHRKLLDIFNILNHSLMEGESQEYLAAVLKELINCTVWHFSHEERLMLKYNYEKTEEHKKAHQELINSALELQEKILHSDGALVEKDLIFLDHWLTEHIVTDDMELGTFLSQVM
ncbi:MAG: hemerythrin family protein [Gammaproteobacteria bacterium]|nr:hemerythrin family protein [Gammaproteobacteria bacterium]